TCKSSNVYLLTIFKKLDLTGTTKILTSVKYAYLIAFFALLSGIFYPFIQGGGLDYTILGIIVLFVGLAGTIMIYKASTTEKRRGFYISIGFGLVAISLFFILQLTGRPIL
ncbi:MAG: hypothetical protein ACKO7N_02855, partial [Candidatus Nitrosotenuis sp.]